MFFRGPAARVFDLARGWVEGGDGVGGWLSRYRGLGGGGCVGRGSFTRGDGWWTRRRWGWRMSRCRVMIRSWCWRCVLSTHHGSRQWLPYCCCSLWMMKAVAQSSRGNRSGPQGSGQWGCDGCRNGNHGSCPLRMRMRRVLLHVIIHVGVAGHE